MTWQTWLLYSATDAFAYLVPGPAVLLVVSQALSRGAMRTTWAIVGILGAEVMYFALSATSVAVLLVASYDVFFTIKWIGTGYLVWLGIQAFRGKAAGFSVGPAAGRTPPLRAIVSGFVLNAANPKVLLFYTAILPQFVDPRAAVAPQMLLLGITGLAVGAMVFIGYAIAAGRMARRLAQPRFARITNRVTGSLLIVAGAGMAAIRRH
jgi:homoserine/homoserine lactone efflux protein